MRTVAVAATATVSDERCSLADDWHILKKKKKKNRTTTSQNENMHVLLDCEWVLAVAICFFASLTLTLFKHADRLPY